MHTLDVFLLEYGDVLATLEIKLGGHDTVKRIKEAAWARLEALDRKLKNITLRFIRQDFWGDIEFPDETQIVNIGDTVNARFMIMVFHLPKYP